MPGHELGPLVFVTVGTDHHPFQRLIDSIGSWSAANPLARVVVQHGTARPVAGLASTPFLSPERFGELLRDADAVVCPGGPGAIMETRASGLRPIVVPRRADLGEHVDDHQRAFAVFLAERALVTLTEERNELFAALDAVLVSPDAYVIGESQGSPAGISGVGALIDGLVWGT